MKLLVIMSVIFFEWMEKKVISLLIENSANTLGEFALKIGVEKEL